MIQAVIDGIVGAIYEEYGDERPIYTDNVEQGLDEGSFSVRSISPTQRQFLGNRYFREHPIAITYFPLSTEGNTEINGIIEKLFSILEYITVSGDLVRGTKMNAHIEDGTMIFTVNYDFFVHKVRAEETNMNNLEMRESVHEEG